MDLWLILFCICSLKLPGPQWASEESLAGIGRWGDIAERGYTRSSKALGSLGVSDVISSQCHRELKNKAPHHHPKTGKTHRTGRLHPGFSIYLHRQELVSPGSPKTKETHELLKSNRISVIAMREKIVGRLHVSA